jgi:uncharacterized protein (DUF697 family)
MGRQLWHLGSVSRTRAKREMLENLKSFQSEVNTMATGGTTNGTAPKNSTGQIAPQQELFTPVTVPNIPDLQLKEPKAQDSILKYSLIAAGVGLIPIPLLDSVGLFSAQFLMARELNALYFPTDTFFETEPAKKTFLLIVGSIVPNSGFKYLAFSMLKAIPFIGTGVAMLTMPVLAGTTTYALGQVLNKNFAEGNTFLSLDPLKYREFYQAMLLQGAPAMDTAIKATKAKQAQQAAATQAHFDEAAVQALQRVITAPMPAPAAAPAPAMVSPAPQAAPPEVQLARMIDVMQRVMAQPVSAPVQPVSPAAQPAMSHQERIAHMVDVLQQSSQAAQSQAKAAQSQALMDQAAAEALRRVMVPPPVGPAPQAVAPAPQAVAPAPQAPAAPQAAPQAPPSPTDEHQQLGKMIELLQQMRDMMTRLGPAPPAPAPPSL